MVDGLATPDYSCAMEPLLAELETVRARLAAGHDVVPFMMSYHPVSELQFQALPDNMLQLLRQSPDWSAITPGVPTWVEVAAGNEAAELVLYRTGSGVLYVLAPCSASPEPAKA